MCKEKKLILKLAGKNLKEYCIENKKKILISNKTDQSIRGNPYIEINYDRGDGTMYVYNSNYVKNQLCAGLYSQLNTGDDILSISDKRFYMMDLQIYAIVDDINPDFLFYKQYEFIENTNISEIFQKKGYSTYDSTLYFENTLHRQSVWVYYPSTIVYCLVQKNPLKIYAMQTYSNQYDTSINPTNLSYLAEKLILPDGWIYSYICLDKKTYLCVPTNTEGEAFAVTDNLYNTYQYIDETYAPWLYKKYV